MTSKPTSKPSTDTVVADVNATEAKNEPKNEPSKNGENEQDVVVMPAKDFQRLFEAKCALNEFIGKLRESRKNMKKRKREQTEDLGRFKKLKLTETEENFLVEAARYGDFAAVINAGQLVKSGFIKKYFENMKK